MLRVKIENKLFQSLIKTLISNKDKTGLAPRCECVISISKLWKDYLRVDELNQQL